MEILRVEADDVKSSSSGGSDVGSAVADLEDFLDVLLLQNSPRLAEFFAAHSAETVDIEKERRNQGFIIKTFLQKDNSMTFYSLAGSGFNYLYS